jgi:hypothetical protein
MNHREIWAWPSRDDPDAGQWLVWGATDSLARYIRADLYADQARELADRLASCWDDCVSVQSFKTTQRDVIAFLRSIAETKP